MYNFLLPRCTFHVSRENWTNEKWKPEYEKWKPEFSSSSDIIFDVNVFPGYGFHFRYGLMPWTVGTVLSDDSLMIFIAGFNDGRVWENQKWQVKQAITGHVVIYQKMFENSNFMFIELNGGRFTCPGITEHFQSIAENDKSVQCSRLPFPKTGWAADQCEELGLPWIDEWHLTHDGLRSWLPEVFKWAEGHARKLGMKKVIFIADSTFQAHDYIVRDSNSGGIRPDGSDGGGDGNGDVNGGGEGDGDNKGHDIGGCDAGGDRAGDGGANGSGGAGGGRAGNGGASGIGAGGGDGRGGKGGCSGQTTTIHVITPTAAVFDSPGGTISEIKQKLFDPIDSGEMKLRFKGRNLTDEDKVPHGSTIYAALLRQCCYKIKDENFQPMTEYWDRDGRKIWRYPFVCDKPKWVQNDHGWDITFHSTGLYNGKSMEEEGFIRSRAKCGIYSTPNMEFAFLYAPTFRFEDKNYQVVIENHVERRSIEDLPPFEKSKALWRVRDHTAMSPSVVIIREIGFVAADKDL